MYYGINKPWLPGDANWRRPIEARGVFDNTLVVLIEQFQGRITLYERGALIGTDPNPSQ